MSITRLALRIAAPLPRIEDYERYMFIGPHPDDIEIGAGATAAKLAAAGKKVCFLICIDGRFGSDTIAPEELIAIRQLEARASAAALGVDDVRYLPFCDGGFYDTRELVSAIAKAVGDFKPDVIFAPDCCVTSECHPDHLNVGRAASEIAYLAPYSLLMAEHGAQAAPVKAIAYYMTAKPNRYVKTSAALLKKQLASIFDCHRSQFPSGCPEAKSIAMYLRLRSADFGLRRLCGHAEGFRVLGVTQMHCLPEAGK